jgi:hypothetical protein
MDEYERLKSLLKKIMTKYGLTVMLQLASNPKSMFIRGRGQILHILNEEYGVALAAMKQNSWESILFHRSACFLFKLNLGSHDLTKIFKEGKFLFKNSNILCRIDLACCIILEKKPIC